MTNKQIIQIVIIIAGLGGAALILYNGFFKNSPQSVQSLQSVQISDGSQAGQPENADILPLGDSLNFSRVIDRNRFQYNQAGFPKLDPQNEVGIDPNRLVVPKPNQP